MANKAWKFTQDFTKFKKGDVVDHLGNEITFDLARRGIIEPASESDVDKSVKDRMKRNEEARKEAAKAEDTKAKEKAPRDKEVKAKDLSNK